MGYYSVNPIEALERAIFITSHARFRNVKRPGQAYESLPESLKESLRQLRSEDTQLLRWDYVSQFV